MKNDVEYLENKLQRLQTKHRELDKDIETNYKNYQNDQLLEIMKKEKLRLRDEMELVSKVIEIKKSVEE